MNPFLMAHDSGLIALSQQVLDRRNPAIPHVSHGD